MDDLKIMMLREFYDDFEKLGIESLMTYKILTVETGKKKEILKMKLMELRREGLIELWPNCKMDFEPYDSGYILTDKGHKLVEKLFLPVDKRILNLEHQKKYD